ncbi:MAG: phosphatidylserine decarboxylase [Clostridia bacterium]|nr:phosphatidylserine decarboxylase [Clostridia bacterium]
MEQLIHSRTVLPRPRDGAALRFLYHTTVGRLLLKPLRARPLSRLCGRFLDSTLSKPLIKPFVRKNGIRLEDFFSDNFRCFNDCFSRRIRPELRPVDASPDALVAPCDGLLSVYPIHSGTVIPAKQSLYTINDLLGGDPMAARFEGGACLVFRLCVNHYHRYCYPDGGRLLRNGFIPGELHTVRPIALEQMAVFVRNCREYALFETDHLGTVAQIEVGAMLVGKIANHPAPERFERGDEKGMFLYGGSTVILLIEPGRIQIPEEVFALSAEEKEIPVCMGERIADLAEAVQRPA